MRKSFITGMAARSLVAMLLVGSITLEDYQTAGAVKLSMQMASDAEMALELSEMLDDVSSQEPS